MENSLRVLVCPDAFKGTHSAAEIAVSIVRGVGRVFPDAHFDQLPLADGGPGTLTTIAAAIPCRREQAVVSGPLGKPVDASYLVLEDGSCVIEVAQVIALASVDKRERAPLRATSFGVGELLRVATERVPRSVVVTLGGSATNDAGYGFAQALGYRFLDNTGTSLPMPSASRSLPELLTAVARVDSSAAVLPIASTELLAATDVDNPLCGPRGATYVYGMQKGLVADELDRVDTAIAHFAKIIARDRGSDVVDRPGAGAAGGLGAALVAFCDAQLTSGFDWIARVVDLDHHLRTADLVVTGEGRLDRQTAYGKTVSGVARRARAFAVPVIAITGSLEVDRATLDRLGIDHAYACPLAGSSADQQASLDDVAATAERAARDYVNLRAR